MTDTNEYLDRLMRIVDVARTFDVTVATVRNWEASGKISAVRTPGGQRRFRQSDVDRILAQTTTTGAEQ